LFCLFVYPKKTFIHVIFCLQAASAILSSEIYLLNFLYLTFDTGSQRLVLTDGGAEAQLHHLPPRVVLGTLPFS
jgi:hypothetical protein